MKKQKFPGDLKAILYSKRISGGITIPDLKFYYRAVVIKTVLYGHKKTHWSIKFNRRSDKNPHIHGHLIFWNKARNRQWTKKEAIFNKWCWSNWLLACRRIQIDPSLSPCTKLKSKWIKDLNIKSDTLKLKRKQGVIALNPWAQETTSWREHQ